MKKNNKIKKVNGKYWFYIEFLKPLNPKKMKTDARVKLYLLNSDFFIEVEGFGVVDNIKIATEHLCKYLNCSLDEIGRIKELKDIL